MSGFLDAVSLLTRLPVRAGRGTDRAAPWLPVVGAFVGAVVALVYAALRSPLSPLLSAALATAVGILLTGGLHEDGLADFADAIGAGVERAERIRILHDPHHGTYGVLALALSVSVRIVAIAELDAAAAVVAIPAAHALSRAVLPSVMFLLPFATDGLGASYARRLGGGNVIAACLIGVAFGVGLLGVWIFLAGAVTAGTALLIGILARRKIGGVAGDVLGALQQLAEIGVLVVSVAAAGSIPWWRA